MTIDANKAAVRTFQHLPLKPSYIRALTLGRNRAFGRLIASKRKLPEADTDLAVTHNANLVINTDADQVIIAEAGTPAPGELPTISYASGGLEGKAIRDRVCSILEGGEEAFKSRARRLRVTL